MNSDLFSLRETEIFRALEKIRHCDFVVIGGYAVNVYTLPRFSVDCDIVVKGNQHLKCIEAELVKLGYEKEKTPSDAQYCQEFLRYEKTIEENFSVSMDILVGKVSDRLSNAVFEAGWIFENSRIQTLRGKTIFDQIKARVVDIDALIAMKVASCRATDIRDVFMLCPNMKSPEWIKREVKKRTELSKRIAKIIEKVESKQFNDGLAGVYGGVEPKVFEKHRKALDRLRET